MGRHKKLFPCGHRGYGQLCHKCVDKDRRLKRRQEERASWESLFEQDAIDLRGLPKPVVLKTREILARLDEGALWGTLGGKKLNHDRTLISIPVNRDYRLLCRQQADAVVPLKAISHEEYNVAKPGS